MLKKLKNLLIVALCLAPVSFAAVPVYADSASSQIQCGVNAAVGDSTCSSTSQPTGDLASTIKKVLNILSAVAGVAAVIMLMVAGVRLVTSAGSENAVKGAKSTIIYAVVGLVLVALAQIIVHFVINNVA